MKIEDIASVHLGKAGDGSVVKPYVTPDKIDPSLLVGIPRELNRTQYNLDENNLPFIGWDVWNAYEFSTLLDNGYPLSGVLRISYSALSPNIVESKSLKLYLNSFNMVKIGKYLEDAVNTVEANVERHLAKVLGSTVKVKLHYEEPFKLHPIKIPAYNIDLDDYNHRYYTADFSDYNENPDLLKFIDDSQLAAEQHFVFSRSLRSNCRVTNQPDWGDVYIYYDSKKMILPQSILQYIVSMRNENHFHEEICECIYKRLHDKLGDNMHGLLVACLYTRRGGIDINPVRASNQELLDKFASNLYNVNILPFKTMRQ